MNQLIRNGVELCIFNNRFEGLTIYGKIGELEFWSINQSTNIKGLDGEVDRVSRTVKYGGY